MEENAFINQKPRIQPAEEFAVEEDSVSLRDL